MLPDNPRVKAFMKQTKNTNKLPSYVSQSCNLGRSVCHMSSGGQVKGSVAKLQLFLAALPSLFPGSRPNPWCQRPSFHQLGHLNSRPQSSWPFSLLSFIWMLWRWNILEVGREYNPCVFKYLFLVDCFRDTFSETWAKRIPPAPGPTTKNGLGKDCQYGVSPADSSLKKEERTKTRNVLKTWSALQKMEWVCQKGYPARKRGWSQMGNSILFKWPQLHI